MNDQTNGQEIFASGDEGGEINDNAILECIKNPESNKDRLIKLTTNWPYRLDGQSNQHENMQLVKLAYEITQKPSLLAVLITGNLFNHFDKLGAGEGQVLEDGSTIMNIIKTPFDINSQKSKEVRVLVIDALEKIKFQIITTQSKLDPKFNNSTVKDFYLKLSGLQDLQEDWEIHPSYEVILIKAIEQIVSNLKNR